MKRFAEFTPEQQKARRKYQAEYVRKVRQDPVNTAKFLFQDSRNGDNKRGMEFNLTIEFIDEQISKGCSYCGCREGRITLDRIDNSIGHVVENVVPSCYRCNMIRRDMPIEAWLLLVPSIREAYERGLFGNWTAGIHKHYYKE